MIILNRLEKFVSQVEYISEMQFGFQEGSGCIEASFTILETINYMLERGSKIISCFVDVRKAFDTVWIDGLMYQLFSDLGVNGLPFKAYTLMLKHGCYIHTHYLENSRFHRVQDRGRILAPFMYKVDINSFLNKPSDHCLAISINT